MNVLRGESDDSASWRSAKGRRLCQFLVMLFFGLFVLDVAIPIQDYAKRELLAYIREPSKQNLEALRAKQEEERRTQWLYASPFAVLGIVVAIPLLTKYRRRP
jgi:hypothetical protein